MYAEQSSHTDVVLHEDAEDTVYGGPVTKQEVLRKMGKKNNTCS